jgi:hypothetical protein
MTRPDEHHETGQVVMVCRNQAEKWWRTEGDGLGGADHASGPLVGLSYVEQLRRDKAKTLTNDYAPGAAFKQRTTSKSGR